MTRDLSKSAGAPVKQFLAIFFAISAVFLGFNVTQVDNTTVRVILIVACVACLAAAGFLVRYFSFAKRREY